MITFQRHFPRTFKQLRSFTSSSTLTKKNEGSDGNDEKKLTQKEVTNKLNNLLQMMIEKEDDQPKKTLNLTTAAKKRKEKAPPEKALDEKLADAAKEVATSIGGNVEKTESELLNILLRRTDTGSELNDVLKGIKVEKSAEPPSRAQQVRESMGRQPYGEPSRTEFRKPRKKEGVYVDILAAEPTSYFSNLKPMPQPCELRTWQSCVDRDLRLAVTHPPTNIYEQMIQWTDQGLLWQFPIDNEQGLDEERKVSFEEHIFLENHLEGWCPERGPIRHFMELVCVGLSKNHWLTAAEKKNHILWYRDYFAEKNTLIQELGAGTIQVEAEERTEGASQ